MDHTSAPTLDPLVAELATRARRRWIAGLLALATGTLLVVAAWLSPSGAGHGTHLQLGLPPCGWVVGMGIPCPSCGMTTAFAHAADGDLLGAMRAQPAGAMLALGTAVVFVLSAWVLLTGSGIGGFWFERLGKRTLLVGGVVILGSWVYKILVFKGVL